MSDESKKEGEFVSVVSKSEVDERADDFAVVPSPSNGEAVKEALDIAQSFGALRNQRPIGGTFNIANFDDSISLSEYIEEAEKRSKAIFESSNSEQGPVEDLEILSIAAEFGRPDDSSETSEEVLSDGEKEYSEVLFQEEKTGEDTRDLTLKSRNPPAAEEEKSEKAPSEKEGSDDNILAIDAIGATEPLSSLSIEEKFHLPNNRPDFGDLNETSLIEIVFGLYLQKGSGMLILKDKQTTNRLFFLDGDIVTAETSDEEKGYIRWLRKEGYLDEETYSSLLREVSSLNNLQSGSALVSRGIIGPRDMNRLLRKYYEYLVDYSFGWKSGTWRFEGNNRFSPGDTSVIIESSTPSIIFNALLRHTSAEDVKETAPPFSFLRKTTTGGVCKLAELGLDEVGLGLLDACDGTSNIWNRIAQSPHERDRYHRIISAFVKFRFIEICEPVRKEIETGESASPWESFPDDSKSIHDEKIEFYSEGETGGDLAKLAVPLKRNSFSSIDSEEISSLGEAVGRADNLRKMVMSKLEAVREGSYYDILEIGAVSSADSVREQWKILVNRFDWHQLSAMGLVDLESELNLIKKVLDEAYDVLTHPSIAEAYRRAQEKSRDGQSRH